MNRRQWTELIIEYGNHQIEDYVALFLEKYSIEEIIPPHLGLVMIKKRETAKQSLFYIGEILVTETKVRFGDKIGLGLVKGDNPDLSRALAIFDLAYVCRWPEWQYLQAWFKELSTIKLEDRRRQTKAVMQTKVDFSTMSV